MPSGPGVDVAGAGKYPTTDWHRGASEATGAGLARRGKPGNDFDVLAPVDSGQEIEHVQAVVMELPQRAEPLISGYEGLIPADVRCHGLANSLMADTSAWGRGGQPGTYMLTVVS